TPPPSTLFPYTTLFRSPVQRDGGRLGADRGVHLVQLEQRHPYSRGVVVGGGEGRRRELPQDPALAVLVRQPRHHESVLRADPERSEEHTSELQSPYDLV